MRIFFAHSSEWGREICKNKRAAVKCNMNIIFAVYKYRDKNRWHVLVALMEMTMTGRNVQAEFLP